ncbi:MAG: ABC transporter ATP-binding protein [Candidatus Aminicenantes bacterium]|nr:ABC transporter ATP-binding protein [Candidatus Aminicenantes bacterium]
MSDLILEVRGLRKSFGQIKAVSSINLNLKPGELLALVGPDGAGKTTTLRLLCGLEKAEAGEIVLFGRQVIEFDFSLRGRIGYLPQNFSLYGDLTVEENMEFFAGLYGIKNYQSLIESLLEFTRLKPFRQRLADKLSGGMKQKLGLACTLIHQPDLLLLDEPTTGVDPVSRRDFWQILFKLQQEKKSIMMSTPYLDEAERASRVAFIYQGEILALAPPDELKAGLQGRVLEIVTSEVRKLYQRLKKENMFLDVQLFGDRVNLIIPSDFDWLQFRNQLAREKFDIQSAALISPSLENSFIFMMKKKTEVTSNDSGH